MTDDWLLSLIYAAWLTASTIPLGFMLGSSCSPCCGCGVADGKPRTDPKNEGTWVPSGTWRGVGGVTWTFNANPGDESGETWFFYGSAATSKAGGSATNAEQQDWGNLCNWYSSKTTSPSTTSGLPAAFDKRATRLPPETAVVHFYTSVGTQTNRTVKSAYFWSAARLLANSNLTSTTSAHDSIYNTIFNDSATNRLSAIVNGGATFNDFAVNTLFATVNDGAVFNHSARNDIAATVNGGATFNDSSENFDSTTVNGGATFNDWSINDSATVNGGATFNNNSQNRQGATINGGAIFNNDSRNRATVNDGATFNDDSQNFANGTVNGGATFNDAACSFRFVGSFFATPCTKQFVAHPTDLPTCNGTAADGCTAGVLCGCG